MDSELRDRVIETEERLRQAMLHSDVHVLDELISPELLFTDHFGHLASKEDDLAAHRSGVYHWKSIEQSEQHIQLHAGFAVVSVLVHLVGAYMDTPIDESIRYTRVWLIAPDGSMQIIAGHMSAFQPV